MTSTKTHLIILFDGAQGDIELRAFNKDNDSPSGRLFTRDLMKIMTWIEEHQERCNLYFGVCTRKPGSYNGKKEDCFEITSYWGDIDFKDFSGGEKEARESLAHFPLKPTIVVHSGGGLHVYWVLKEPEHLNGSFADHEARMRGIAKAVRGDRVFDIARVLRIPGTINYPTAKKRVMGRTEPAPCIVEYADGPKYNPSDFDEWKIEQASKPVMEVSAPQESLPERFLEDLRKDTNLRELWEGIRVTLRPGSKEIDRSRMDSQLTHRLVKLGCKDEEIASILFQYSFGKTHERKDQGDYMSRTIADARRAQSQQYSGDSEKEKLGDENSKHEKISKLIVEEAKQADLFHTEEGDAYVSIRVDRHVETHRLRSSGFRLWLQLAHFKRSGRPPGAQVMEEALSLLEAQARFEGPEHKVFTRIAETETAIYLDLATKDWQAVEITSSGWQVVSTLPVKFQRRKGMLPLPVPVQGGSVEDLRQFINVPDEDSWRVLNGWLINTIKPRGPYPILSIQGPQDSAKSTASRVIKSLIDPFKAGLRSIPRSEHDLMISAVNSWILAFDNLSNLTPWLSDALCRLATGGGFATRELYTNSDEILLDAMRPMILNGIGQLGARQDLLDRMVTLTLSPIEDERRRAEEEFWREFESVRPRILGALCNAVSTALKNLPDVKLSKKPRMADFAVWVTAAESALPWKPGEFLKAYEGNRSEAMETALESDLVAMAVMKLTDQEQTWEGTPTELLKVLNDLVSEETRKSRSWPKAANVLGVSLRRASKALRSIGVSADFGKKPGTKSKRLITIKKVPKNADATAAADANNEFDDHTQGGKCVGGVGNMQDLSEEEGIVNEI